LEGLDDGILGMQSSDGEEHLDSPPLSSERRRELARQEAYPHAALARIRSASRDFEEQAAASLPLDHDDPSAGSASQQIIRQLGSRMRENTRYSAYNAARSHSQSSIPRIGQDAAASLSHLHI
jgi:hypothetical protein